VSDGVSATLANAWLTTLAGYTLSVSLADGDPGSAGTSNPSSVTTKESLTLGSASAGAIAASNTPTWATWAGTNGEVVTDIAIWNGGTTFEDSIQLGTGVTVYTGDTLEVTAVGIAFPTAS
jgi:hypothetical protein